MTNVLGEIFPPEEKNVIYNSDTIQKVATIFKEEKMRTRRAKAGRVEKITVVEGKCKAPKYVREARQTNIPPKSEDIVCLQ